MDMAGDQLMDLKLSTFQLLEKEGHLFFILQIFWGIYNFWFNFFKFVFNKGKALFF